MKVNQRLRRERELRGWSQAKVAAEIGTDPATVGRWERGLSFPYPYFREKLCALFGKNAEELGLVQPDHDAAFQLLPSPTAVPRREFSAVPSPLYDPAIPLPSGLSAGLIGRDSLLDSLRELLCSGDPTTSLQALYGLPGVGKTALAMQLAHDPKVQECFSDGVLWAALGPHPNVLTQLSRWGSLLNIVPSENTDRKSSDFWAEALRSFISTRRFLLVIDDAWQAEEALALKIGGPNCAYIITTRFPQIALDFAGDGARVVHELSEDDGVALLARLIPDIVSNNLSIARDLVRSVGGLPLALTLIGKYLRSHAYSQQPRRIQSAIKKLLEGQGSLRLSVPYALVERHPSLDQGTTLSLMSVIAVSDQQLLEQTSRALHSLAVFPAKPNSFSEKSALAFCADSVEVLDQLSDAGILESSGPGRYTLHQTIADYALMHLDDVDAYQRFVSFFVKDVDDCQSDYHALERESSNILAALEMAYEREMLPALMQLVKSCAPFWLARGLYDLAREQLYRALTAAVTMVDVQSKMTVLLYLGELAQKTGDFSQAETDLKTGLDLARSENDTAQAARLLMSLGSWALRLSDYSNAEGYLQEALVLAYQHEDDVQISTILRHLGQVETKRGQYDQAEIHLQEGLQRARKLGHVELIIALLTRLGVVAGERAAYAQAEAYLQEGLQLAREIGHREFICYLLLNLGCVFSECGSYAPARECFHNGLDLARSLGHRDLLCVLLVNLGITEYECSAYAQAQASLQEGLALALLIGSKERIGSLLDTLARVAIALQEYEQAAHYIEDALPMARQIEHPELLSSVLLTAGNLALGRNDFASADSYLQEALFLAREVGKPHTACECLYTLGELFLQQENLADASRFFREMLQSVPEGSQELVAKAQFGLARTCFAQSDYQTASTHARASLTFFSSCDHHLASQVEALLTSLASF